MQGRKNDNWQSADQAIVPEESRELANWLRGLLVQFIDPGPNETFDTRLSVARWRLAVAFADRLSLLAESLRVSIHDRATTMARPAEGADDRLDRATAEILRDCRKMRKDL
jgi:hypothetical protein